MIQTNRKPKDNHHQTATDRRVNGNSLRTSPGPPMFIQPREGERNNGLVFRNGAWRADDKT